MDSRNASMDVAVMTDMCHGGCPGAATPRSERKIVADSYGQVAGFDRNYEDCSERHGLSLTAYCPQSGHKELHGRHSREEIALHDQEKNCGGDRSEGSSRADECYENDLHPCRKLSLQLDGAVTPTILASAIAFLGLPLLVFLGVMTRQQPPPLRLLTDLKVPALIGIESLIFAGPEAVLYLSVEALRRANHSAPFAVLRLTRLLYTVWLVVSFKANGPLLASGFAMMGDRFVMAAFLYAYESYSKYLVCLPRTLRDLYDSETCTLPMWCQKPSGRSKEDILRACACLYEMLATSEHSEVIQAHHEKYGPHMHNFVRDTTLGGCVWACALCLAVLVTFSMIKTVFGDVAAVVLFYKRYAAEQREGATRSCAFQVAALRLLAADTPLTEPLPVAGPSRTAAEQADVYGQAPTSDVEHHTTAVVKAPPTAAELS